MCTQHIPLSPLATQGSWAEVLCPPDSQEEAVAPAQVERGRAPRTAGATRAIRSDTQHSIQGLFPICCPRLQEIGVFSEVDVVLTADPNLKLCVSCLHSLTTPQLNGAVRATVVGCPPPQAVITPPSGGEGRRVSSQPKEL